MIWFKACPRCKVGDLSLSEDIYGKYLQCFQCGHIVYPREEAADLETLAGDAGKQRAAA